MYTYIFVLNVIVFLPVCCCVPKAATAIPEFKQRIPEGKTIIPVSMLRHHALVDGMHIARFYKSLDEQLPAIVRP